MFALNDVVFSYGADRPPALRGLTFSAPAGSFTALMGASASGKSTWAKLLNAILLPQAGEILIDGLSTAAAENRALIRRRVSLVSQNPDDQIVATTVEEDVAFGPGNLGLPATEVRERTDEALRLTGLESLRFKDVGRLSGGQKQKLALAGALALRPKALVLDEATAMLDPAGRDEILDMVCALRRRKNLTVFWCTHRAEEALRAERLVVLRGGAIALDGAPAEILSRPDIAGYGILPPPCGILLQKLAAAGCLAPERPALSPESCAGALAALWARRERKEDHGF
ncbi:MAG: ATP-binding cassette domain-containing protein [Gracilibacteraceae bacterium]|jgi:energy-coupling factor transporter ATP-binding protein EcfA2|nr:ATP-binding cassette domain-containing protein [Gracilibacteraceae bacterium]